MPGWGGGKCPTTVPAIIFRPEASLVLDGRRCLTPSGPSIEPFSAVCLLLTGHRGRVSFADEGTETGDRQSWAWVPAVRWGLGSAPTRTRVSRPNSWPLLCCHRLKPRVPFTERQQPGPHLLCVTAKSAEGSRRAHRGPRAVQSQTATQGRVGMAFCLHLTLGPTGTVACNPPWWGGWPHPCLDPRDPSSTSPHVSTTQNVSRYCPVFSGTGEGLGAGAGKSPPENWGFLVAKATFSTAGGGTPAAAPLVACPYGSEETFLPQGPRPASAFPPAGPAPSPQCTPGRKFSDPPPPGPRLPVSCSLSSWPR